MARYAKNTKVSGSSSVAEIERILNRYGATGFAYGRDDDYSRAFVGFKIGGLAYKIFLPLPDPKDNEFISTPTGLDRHPDLARKEWEQAIKQRWRAMALVIKAKLEAAESGISSVEAEFLAHILLPNNQTIADLIYPQLQLIVEQGKMPPLLTEFTK